MQLCVLWREKSITPHVVSAHALKPDVKHSRSLGHSYKVGYLWFTSQTGLQEIEALLNPHIR